MRLSVSPALPAWPSRARKRGSRPIRPWAIAHDKYKEQRDALLHHGSEMTTSSPSPSRTSLPTVASKSPSTAQSSQLNVAADSTVTTVIPRSPSQLRIATDNKVSNPSVPGQSAQINLEADKKVAANSRPSSRAPVKPKSRPDAAALDPTSEKATLTLIRRTLVADGNNGTDPKEPLATIEGLLPPLTSSNEVDVQLYAIVAIVIKDFVNSWYSKITPDRTFVDEVIQIIAHCTRALEQRLRQVDITEFVLDELPFLVERHIDGELRGMKRLSLPCPDMFIAQYTVQQQQHRPLCNTEKAHAESITH